MDGNERPQGFTEPPEENKTLESFDGAEEIPESFRCCVCLELLYKPVVLVCGHVSCFWCVHTAMSGARESHCPICRNPFLHFPSVCELLHFLLLKINPVVYKRRESQAREDETRTGYFSPEISDRPANESVNKHNWKNNEDGREALPIENSLQENGLGEGTLKHISVTDVLCKSCKKLLVVPVVLNCGHVYCRSCLTVPVDGSLNCQDCQSSHPGKFPKACLVLDHFLEEQFPKAYSIRSEEIQVKLDHPQEVQSPCTSLNEKECGKSQPSENDFALLQERGLEVNVGVGCDSCGMYPIIGKWYRCKDCMEKIGFDLCESCYDTRSKLPGRFNQQHTPDHRLMLVQPERLRGILWGLLTVSTDDEHQDSQDTDSSL
ncbi:E3 ubiquitin-protein ligase PRT1-like isoform X2 [Aristolochia californica]|uniref:E3 ubiquitin-protein ligase PRT1-like isoform X2 n=1 Tax=Aristolochia californica TaxID=171875 RepID=UPI0035DC8720